MPGVLTKEELRKKSFAITHKAINNERIRLANPGGGGRSRGLLV